MAATPPLLTPWKLRQARQLIQTGGLIAYPTESVFGLGCNPLDRQAVERLLALKQRPVDKGLILIADRYEQLRPFIQELEPERMEPLHQSWPGPHTWLLPAAPDTPRWLTGDHDTLAVRVTAHPVAAALCRAAGSPLVSTSANRSGRPPARTPLEVRLRCAGGVDMIIHQPLGGLARPTRITDARSLRLLRG